MVRSGLDNNRYKFTKRVYGMDFRSYSKCYYDNLNGSYDGKATKSAEKSHRLRRVKMIKVKVTKNIIRNGTMFLGLTLKQIIMGGASFAIGILMVVLLKGRMSTNAMMSLVFVVMLALLATTVIQIQGLSFPEFLYLCLKGVDKRPYDVKGVFNNEISENLSEKK